MSSLKYLIKKLEYELLILTVCMFFSVIQTVRVIAVKGTEATSISHMKERRAKMMTAARSTVHPPPPPPIRKKESTVTAATVNSSVTEGYGKTLTWLSLYILLILYYIIT